MRIKRILKKSFVFIIKTNVDHKTGSRRIEIENTHGIISFFYFIFLFFYFLSLFLFLFYFSSCRQVFGVPARSTSVIIPVNNIDNGIKCYGERIKTVRTDRDVCTWNVRSRKMCLVYSGAYWWCLLVMPTGAYNWSAEPGGVAFANGKWEQLPFAPFAKWMNGIPHFYCAPQYRYHRRRTAIHSSPVVHR